MDDIGDGWKKEAEAKLQERLARKREKEEKKKAVQQWKRDAAEAAELRQRAREPVQKRAEEYRAEEKRLKDEREELIKQEDTRSDAQALAFARAYFKKKQKEELEAIAQRAKEVGEKRAAAEKMLAKIDAMRTGPPGTAAAAAAAETDAAVSAATIIMP